MLSRFLRKFGLGADAHHLDQAKVRQTLVIFGDNNKQYRRKNAKPCPSTR
jgi:hypothetical protein